MGDPLDSLLEKLIENEMAMSRLYQQFGDTFAEDADLWKQMAQEKAHPAWIEE